MNLPGAAALEREVDVALVGDHRALSRHERFAETHPKQLQFWFAIALASFSLNRPSTRSPVMPAKPSPPPGARTALLHLGLRLAALPAPADPLSLRTSRCRAPPIGARLDLTPMGHLIRPTLTVPPPVLVAALGIGLPAAGSGSSHAFTPLRSGFRRHYAVVGAALACLSDGKGNRPGTGAERPRGHQAAPRHGAVRRVARIVALAVVWWFFGAGWAALLLVGVVLGGGAAVLMKRN